ncbi:Uncharacterized membrane protein YcaP, DUF421 family [Alicyclobacillus vulcanalis]|uniref:Uncharacterized membrane protein YcaP, DUF421 family n=1 Tax=Alicyclobacillus vulcanalis TaxID=252246 RepID=A0A1N7P9I6_9BACL|nr:Uncharacterized membrane protein YcaP, DUF421 family [Alicyclobacillus vulcanalis]
MPHIPLWQFPLRALVLYLMVMVALRIMGKREIGQLSVFDLVVSIMIAELSTLPMEDRRVPIWEAALSIGSLVLFQLVVAVLQMKSHRFRHWIEGEPSVLIAHGRICDREMKRIRYTVHDLLTQLREQGYADVADVEFAILETSGQLSVVPKPEARPITARDLGVRAEDSGLSLTVVVDGKPVRKALEQLGQDEAWLREALRQRGYQLERVFYARVNGRGEWWIDEKDEAPRSNGEGKMADDGREPRPHFRHALDGARREHPQGAEQRKVQQESADDGEQER